VHECAKQQQMKAAPTL